MYIPPLEFHTKISVLCVHSAGIYEHHFVPRAPWSIKIPYIILASVLGSGTVMEAYRYSTAFWIRIQVVKKHVKNYKRTEGNWKINFSWLILLASTFQPTIFSTQFSSYRIKLFKISGRVKKEVVEYGNRF